MKEQRPWLTPWLIVAVAACMHLPHVDPQARPPQEGERAAVKLEVECGEDGDTWGVNRVGSGVVISERHILTAEHVVACPGIPIVHATLSDGQRMRVVVERDDVMFGEGHDIARLELASAGTFGLGIAPPTLGTDHGWATVARPDEDPVWTTGYFVGFDQVEGVDTEAGDSGAGVYDRRGNLVGVVTGRVKWIDVPEMSVLRYEPVESRWMEGT